MPTPCSALQLCFALADFASANECCRANVFLCNEKAFIKRFGSPFCSACYYETEVHVRMFWQVGRLLVGFCYKA